MLEEVRIILDNRMLDNDKYVVDMIMEYVYPRCEQCGLLYEEDKTYKCFDDKYVCIYCYTKYIYKRCYTCRKMYEMNKNEYCRSCIGSCRVYCALCLDTENRRGFTTRDNLAVSSIIDDIIHTANALISNNVPITILNDIINTLSDDDSDLDIEDVD